MNQAFLDISSSGNLIRAGACMIYLNVMLTVKDEANVDKVRGILVELTEAARAEPGCSRFEIYQSFNDRRHFTLVERWDSQAHLDQHRAAPAFSERYAPIVLPLVERTPHPGDLIA